MLQEIPKAVQLINQSEYIVAFTGAGISVESGIPPFRGTDGIWSKYDPSILDLDSYLTKPDLVWPVIKQLFFDFFADAKPNTAHKVLAKLEQAGKLQAVITQNIDNLHQEAGSKKVVEYHGNSKTFICTINSTHIANFYEIDFDKPYPECPVCGELTKPSFIFFGEQIPTNAVLQSEQYASKCDLMIVIGSTGEVVPAAHVPFKAKEKGAKILEINPMPSTFTYSITDLSIKGKAGDVMGKLAEELLND